MRSRDPTAMNRFAQVNGRLIAQWLCRFAFFRHVIVLRDWWVIRRSGAFDRKHYLQETTGSWKVRWLSILHYCLYGWREMRDPSSNFNTRDYLEDRPTLFLNGCNPLVHHLRHRTDADSRRTPPDQHGVGIGGFRGSLLDTVPQRRQPGSIGVHLHLYYGDLTDEMVGYLRNIPFHFDLYASVCDKETRIVLAKALRKCPRAKLRRLEVVPNRGRDLGPMFAIFGESLTRYDFICHVHSKKSLYTGKEQSSWRTHLMFHLLGSEQIVRMLLATLASFPRMGLIYPKTFPSMPYWAHTWLANEAHGRRIFARLGITGFAPGYLDCPVGSMFWARGEALRPLLSLGLRVEDFEEELGQNDGTLAHALERCLVPAVHHAGFHYGELDYDDLSLQVNQGNRNLIQYWKLSASELVNLIGQAEIVSFDLLDTLWTRALLDPADAFPITEMKVHEQVAPDFPYREMRLGAENTLRQDLGEGDVTLADIYAEMAVMSGLTEEELTRIKEVEIETEVALAVPREPLTRLCNDCLTRGKPVQFLSDMYLDGGSLRRIMEKIGLVEGGQMLVSADTGKRKDRGDAWRAVVEQTLGKRFLHVGDNERSDIQMPTDLHLPTYHTMSPVNMLLNSTLGKPLIEARPWKLGDSALLGTVAARLFNDPFCLNETGGRVMFRDLQEFGYAVMGPIFWYFTMWLDRETRLAGIDRLLFLARDGYFLNQLYGHYVDTLCLRSEGKTRRPQPQYLLASRRAATMACARTASDLYAMLDPPYFGSLRNLLSSRFGVNCDTLMCDGERHVQLSADKESLLPLIDSLREDILERSSDECACFLSYLESLGVGKGDAGRVAVVDLGYSATTQLCLCQMLKQPVGGYYFVTTHAAKQCVSVGGEVEACYGKFLDPCRTNVPVFKYSLLLESVLTSADGQLVRFRRSGTDLVPVFNDAVADSRFKKKQEVLTGVVHYFDDVRQHHGQYIDQLDFNPELLQSFLKTVAEQGLIADELRECLVMPDGYCNEQHIDVVGRYAVNNRADK